MHPVFRYCSSLITTNFVRHGEGFYRTSSNCELMSSHPLKIHPARLLEGLKNAEPLQRLILYVTPTSDLKKSRSHVIELYAEAYSEIPDVRTAFSQFSNPALRDWALEPHSQIPEYDPHKTVTNLLSLPARIVSVLKKLILVFLFIAGVGSINWLRVIVLESSNLLSRVTGLVPLSIIVLGMCYLWFLQADTVVHQSLGKELRTGRAKLSVRHRSEIVAHGVWNRSLLGQSGLFLVGVFFLLDSLSELPLLRRWFDDPAGYITKMITTNLRFFYQCDGLFDAIRRSCTKSK